MHDVSVIGGAGKMGRGIASCLLEWLAFKEDDFRLRLIDVDVSHELEIRSYILDQFKRAAEKKIVELRRRYKTSKLIANEEMIEDFLNQASVRLSFHTSLEEAKKSTLVFEAALEEVDFKVDLFKKIKSISSVNPLFLTNTSSIPIHVLNEKADLRGQIIGFHFYNPPPQQPLMEIISLKPGNIQDFAVGLAKDLKKTVVFSNDIAGFIGNGHFLREVHLAFELANKVPIEKIDYITKNLLLRPMGIFQLIDYVGFKVVYNIGGIMGRYGHFKADLKELKKWIDTGYKMNLPEVSSKWKELSKSSNKEAEIRKHFENLAKDSSEEAKIAIFFLEKSAEFMEDLVKEKVAHKIEDVSEVLKLGFHHLYSPNEVLHAVS